VSLIPADPNISSSSGVILELDIRASTMSAEDPHADNAHHSLPTHDESPYVIVDGFWDTGSTVDGTKVCSTREENRSVVSPVLMSRTTNDGWEIRDRTDPRSDKEPQPEVALQHLAPKPSATRFVDPSGEPTLESTLQTMAHNAAMVLKEIPGSPASLSDSSTVLQSDSSEATLSFDTLGSIREQLGFLGSNTALGKEDTTRIDQLEESTSSQTSETIRKLFFNFAPAAQILIFPVYFF